MPKRQKLQMEEMGRMTADEFHEAEKTRVVLVADEIRSLNNIGSLFRTADAFRLEGIVLCGTTGTPPHPEIHKTALGAEYSVEWSQSPTALEAVKSLKGRGYVTLALEQARGSVSLERLPVERGGRYALVVGNEVRGVGQAVVDEVDACVEIPQFGTKHSLNVSVSAGIALWELAKRLLLTN